MRRNLLLLVAVFIGLMLAVNSSRRILSFRTTSQKVDEAEDRLAKLKKENENLKKELETTSTKEFAEAEIRNKLGLSKEGEAVVVIGKGDDLDNKADISQKPGQRKANWVKWRDLFFR